MPKITLFDIRYYINIILKRKWMIAIPFFVVSALFIVATFVMPKVYSATCTILVQQAEVKNPLTRDQNVKFDTDQRLKHIYQLMSSWSNLVKVIKRLDLDVGIEEEEEMEEIIKKMQQTLKVKSKSKNFFEISYEGEDPEMVMAIANTLTSQFIEEDQRQKRKISYAAFDFINSQLKIYEKKLEKSEKALKEYKEANIGQMPGEENINLQRLEQYQSSLIQTELLLKDANLKKTQIQKQLSGKEPLITAFFTRTASPQAILQARLNTLEEKLVLMMPEYTERYPEVIRLKRKIEELKKKLSNIDEEDNVEKIRDTEEETTTTTLNPVFIELQREQGKIDMEIISLKSRYTEFNKKAEEYQNKVKSIPLKEQELVRLTRDYNVNDNIHKMLLRKLEEARISQALESKNQSDSYQIIDRARLPIRPVKPNKIKITLIGLMLGLVAGIGIVYFVESTDTSVKGYRDAEESFSVPILGIIYKMVTEESIRRAKRHNMYLLTSGSFYLIFIVLVSWL